jgi:hypothetical protein
MDGWIVCGGVLGATTMKNDRTVYVKYILERRRVVIGVSIFFYFLQLLVNCYIIITFFVCFIFCNNKRKGCFQGVDRTRENEKEVLGAVCFHSSHSKSARNCKSAASSRVRLLCLRESHVQSNFQ